MLEGPEVPPSNLLLEGTLLNARRVRFFPLYAEHVRTRFLRILGKRVQNYTTLHPGT
jgi:hypothetical protein